MSTCDEETKNYFADIEAQLTLFEEYCDMRTIVGELNYNDNKSYVDD